MCSVFVTSLRANFKICFCTTCKTVDWNIITPDFFFIKLIFINYCVLLYRKNVYIFNFFFIFFLIFINYFQVHTVTYCYRKPWILTVCIVYLKNYLKVVLEIPHNSTQDFFHSVHLFVSYTKGEKRRFITK